VKIIVHVYTNPPLPINTTVEWSEKFVNQNKRKKKPAKTKKNKTRTIEREPVYLHQTQLISYTWSHRVELGEAMM
jgi:hypothetical protein